MVKIGENQHERTGFHVEYGVVEENNACSKTEIVRLPTHVAW